VFAYRPKPIEINPVEIADAPAQTGNLPTEQSKKKKRRRH
jgi:hypothetical protein